MKLANASGPGRVGRGFQVLCQHPCERCNLWTEIGPGWMRDVQANRYEKLIVEDWNDGAGLHVGAAERTWKYSHTVIKQDEFAN
jgi:NMD protein affecting ribosome stability and mRNA decay